MKQLFGPTLSGVLMSAALLGLLGGCAGGNAPASSSGASTSAAAVELQGLEEPIAELPVLLTSVGQSADVEMVRVMLEKGEIDCTVSTLAKPEELEGYNTLILAIGGSTKGLGAAGIDANQELARVDELAKAADEAGMTIIAIHVGGSARRGELSDKFIAPSFTYADYAIVVGEGDGDQLMATLAADAGIPMDYVPTMAGGVDPLKAAFK